MSNYLNYNDFRYDFENKRVKTGDNYLMDRIK